MAKSTKVTDPAEAALSAVEEALKIDFGGTDGEKASFDKDLFGEKERPSAATPDPSSRPTPPPPPPRRDLPPEPDLDANRAVLGRGRSPANDDRRSVANVLYQVQRRPSSAPFWISAVFSIIWIAAGVWLANEILTPIAATATTAELLRRPETLLIGLAVILPVLFFWAIAVMVWRAQDMRIAARSLAEVAVRLAEPEAVAKENVITVGQAIRREVAAMGDGVERALARASELEVLVHNEVAALERSYSENEIRVRSLIEELINQREAVVTNAERVRASIAGAHQGLAEEIRTAGDLIAQRLESTARDVTRTLGDKSGELTSAFDEAGRTMLTVVTERGEEFANRLEYAGREISTRLANETSEFTARFAATGAEVGEQLSTRGADPLRPHPRERRRQPAPLRNRPDRHRDACPARRRTQSDARQRGWPPGLHYPRTDRSARRDARRPCE